VTDWLWQKLDIFLAAVVVAVAGMAACQGHEVMVQYTQRLGAQVNEAREHLADVQGGLRYRVMGETARAELEADARKKFNSLKQAEDAFVHANVITRPLILASHRDNPTLASAWHGFTPTLPLTAGSAFYAFLGMLGGFAIYEIVKFPVMLLVREPRRRKFRRRG